MTWLWRPAIACTCPCMAGCDKCAGSADTTYLSCLNGEVCLWPDPMSLILVGRQDHLHRYVSLLLWHMMHESRCHRSQ